MSPESCFLEAGEYWEGKLSLGFDSRGFLGLGTGLNGEIETLGSSGEGVERCKPLAFAIFFLRNLIFDWEWGRFKKCLYWIDSLKLLLYDKELENSVFLIEKN